MNDVVQSFTSMPKLVLGSTFSFAGAIVGETNRIAEVPAAQTLVWAASIFAALATGALAIARIVIEIRKARRDKD